MKIMAISEKTLKILWRRAGGRCSLPFCNTLLIQEGTENDAPAIIGEVARTPYGPRGKEPFRGTDRDSLENLLLLRPAHHTIVDQLPQTYTVEVLTQMKNQHEQSIQAQQDLDNRISTSISLNQVHNTGVIQGFVQGNHNTNTYHYYHPTGIDTEQAHKAAKQERLRNLYSKILYSARVHHRVLHEMKVVVEGETLESRNARLVRDRNATKQGLEQTVSDLELEQPEASEVVPVFNTLLDACNEYANLYYYNSMVSGYFSDDLLQARIQAADTAFAQLKAICARHLAP